MLIPLLAWLFTAAFLLASAYLLHRLLRQADFRQNLLAFIFLAIFTITLYMFLFGVVGWLRPKPLGFGAILGLALYALLPRTRRALRSAPQDAGRALEHLRAGWSASPRWLRGLLSVALIMSGLRFAFLIWALPPFVWDSLVYHLTNVAEWTQSGRVGLFSTPIDRTALPANFEVFTSWFTVFLHNDLLVETAGVPAYVLCCVALFAIGRDLGLSRSAAAVSSLAFAFTPALVLATTGTKNDPMMVALFLVLISIVLRHLRETRNHKPAVYLNRALLFALVGLYALGTKTYLIYLLPGLLLLAIVATLQQGAGRRWSVLLNARRGLDGRSLGERVVLVMLLAGGFTLGAYWYVRNWAVFQNPFFPYGLIVGGEQILPASHSTFPLSLARLKANLVTLGARFGDKQFAVIPALHLTTGWGWFAYALGLPSLVWGLIRRPLLRGLVLGFLLSALMIFSSVPADPWNMRYLAFLPAVMALGFGFLLDSLDPRWRVEQRWFLGLAVLTLVLNFSMCLNYNRVSLSDFRSILRIPALERGSAHLHVYVDPAYELALNHVPREDVLGYTLTNNSFVHPLYRADYSQTLVYVPITAETSCDAIIQALREADSSWLFALQGRSPPEVLDKLDACRQQGSLDQVEVGLYAVQP
jgi:hypothetical protein